LIRLIHSLQPDCIINARVGNRLGDYAVQEQKIPEGGDPQPWETCKTLNGHWGYKKGDDNWKPASELVANLVEVVSKGGNFLLNVGPTGEGVIPGPSVERLREVGQWMQVNGDAIYGAGASPLPQKPQWGYCTKKTAKDKTTLYLHVFTWPADGELFVPGLKNKVESATLLAGGKKLETTSNDSGVVVRIPAAAPGKISSTVVLKVKGAPAIQ
jgi:alpha-L-fucosidase